jgi:hypothetical protein
VYLYINALVGPHLATAGNAHLVQIHARDRIYCPLQVPRLKKLPSLLENMWDTSVLLLHTITCNKFLYAK